MRYYLILLTFLTIFLIAIIAIIFIKPDIMANFTFRKNAVNGAEISALYSLINKYRVSKNLESLLINSQLEASAGSKAHDMAAKNYFDYQSPSGQLPWDFLTSSGYQYINAGENIAINVGTAQKTLDQWKSNKKHDGVLLGSFQEAGLGFLCKITIGEYKNTCIVVLHVATKKQPDESNAKDLTSSISYQVSPTTSQSTPTTAPPLLTVKTVKDQLENASLARKSWNESTRAVDSEQKKKLIDLLNRQIDYCQTILSRIEAGGEPSSSDLDLWNSVVKMSHESYALAQKLNE